MKKWFLTESQQIIDLNKCSEFWIEDIPTTNKIFCKTDDGIEWTIAEFECKLRAMRYLTDIYVRLNE